MSVSWIHKAIYHIRVDGSQYWHSCCDFVSGLGGTISHGIGWFLYFYAMNHVAIMFFWQLLKNIGLAGYNCFNLVSRDLPDSAQDRRCPQVTNTVFTIIACVAMVIGVIWLGFIVKPWILASIATLMGGVNLYKESRLAAANYKALNTAQSDFLHDGGSSLKKAYAESKQSIVFAVLNLIGTGLILLGNICNLPDKFIFCSTGFVCLNSMVEHRNQCLIAYRLMKEKLRILIRSCLCCCLRAPQPTRRLSGTYATDSSLGPMVVAAASTGTSNGNGHHYDERRRSEETSLASVPVVVAVAGQRREDDSSPTARSASITPHRRRGSSSSSSP